MNNALKAVIAVVAIAVAGYFLYSNLQTRKAADWNNEATRLLDQNKFAEARDLLEQVKVREPDNASVWRNLGVAHEGLKDIPKAIEAFEKSLSLNTNQPDIRANVDALKRGTDSEATKGPK